MAYNPIVIPSKHIYGNPKLYAKNNVINSVSAVEQNLELIKNYNFFSINFMLYTSNTEKPTYNINDYTNHTMDNQIKPYESNGIILYPEATDSNYKSYYIYLKETFKNELLSLYDKFSVDIEHEGTDEILNVGVKTFTYKSNITPDTSTNLYAIKKYDTVEDFENESFNITETAPSNGQISSVKNFNGYIKCGVIFNPEEITVCAIVKAYESSYTSLTQSTSYYRIQKNYILDFYIDNYDIKEITKTYNAQNDSDISIENNEMLQKDTTTTILPYNWIFNANDYEVGDLRYNLFAASAFPVKSDLTVTIKSTLSNTYVFTISSGNNKSNETVEFKWYEFVTSIEVSPKSDDYYYYDESMLNNHSNRQSITTSIANNIIQNYTNGKKTMSLEAGYGDYYYADGTPYGGVAGKKMLLQVGDIVQPMRWDGSKDVPYSLDIYGNSRVYEITSAELNVGGAPKLYLELLEKTT